MTLADKLAALPEMPKLPRPPEWTSVANQMSYYINKGAARGARLALLLETVMAYMEAVDTVNNTPYERDNGQARITALNSRDEASLDLRTLQAHLEGERT